MAHQGLLSPVGSRGGLGTVRKGRRRWLRVVGQRRRPVGRGSSTVGRTGGAVGWAGWAVGWAGWAVGRAGRAVGRAGSAIWTDRRVGRALRIRFRDVAVAVVSGLAGNRKLNQSLLHGMKLYRDRASQ
jgi:hypothetical protein